MKQHFLPQKNMKDSLPPVYLGQSMGFSLNLCRKSDLFLYRLSTNYNKNVPTMLSPSLPQSPHSQVGVFMCWTIVFVFYYMHWESAEGESPKYLVKKCGKGEIKRARRKIVNSDSSST